MATAGHAAGLTDTDILIDAARGVADAGVFLAGQQAAGGIKVSIISAMELVAGCKNATDLTEVRRFLAGVSVVPVAEPTASRDARLCLEATWGGAFCSRRS